MAADDGSGGRSGGGSGASEGSSYAEAWLPEDPATAAARTRAQEVGVVPISPLAGALLRFLAASVGARHVAEVGTGTGVSALWLLQGMTADGVLTSIDVEAEHHRLARESLTDAGVPMTRVRLIAGRALDVLPRLSDGGYDLVHVDGAAAEAADLLPEALRALRRGGLVVFSGALAGGRVADAVSRDAAAVAHRGLGRLVREDESLVPVLLPVGDGVLAALKR